jgi:DNA-binding transcriptional ArsR family regulator
LGFSAIQEAALLAYVPTFLDLYRPLKPRLRWAMQCLVSYADEAGRCFPSLRTFAVQAGISKSAAGRDLAELTQAGLVSCKRRPGGVYVYTIARRFLPRWAAEQVSQHRDRRRKTQRDRNANSRFGGVPQPGTEEKPEKKNQGSARARDRFAWAGGGQDGLPRPVDWTPRLRSWAQSGCWLADWGPRPGEAGCFAPPG